MLERPTPHARRAAARAGTPSHLSAPLGPVPPAPADELQTSVFL